MSSLAQFLEEGAYQSYVYSYPHKTAYRMLEPRPLADVWKDEDQSALFLYAHVPFCEMRCGFCNLFTSAKPKDDVSSGYVQAFQRHAKATREALPDAKYSRIAIGGGTPTQLSQADLRTFLDTILEMGADPHSVPVACETSPETVTPAKLTMLKEFGVDRVSIGVQSFIESETKSLRRPQKLDVALGALDAISMAGFTRRNIDLIYGIENQTPETWLESIQTALKFEPEELFLYPLYVRPLTGLGNSKRAWDDERRLLYRYGRDYLLAHGYEQVTMRMFRRTGAQEVAGPVYRCQEDGMVGLGAGARSYTDALHYSSEYAVGRRGVLDILHAYNDRTEADFAQVSYGFELDQGERKRRYILLSLLSHEGLQDSEYAGRFRSQPMDDFPQLVQLLELRLADKTDGHLTLTDAGVELSDAIGPWLYSENVVALGEEFELR